MHAFPCGTLALDFVGTLRARRDLQPREMLGDAQALDAWFVEAGVVDEAPGARESDLTNAVQLREAIYDIALARLQGTPLPSKPTALLNRWALAAPVRLTLDGGTVRREGGSSEGLATVARNAVELFGGDDAALLRECGRPGCTQVYVDRSRGGRREWCSMRTCGNRVKAAQFRARHRGASANASS
ncbi:CGNR zinc finger domain-containing protein [Microbacterium sp. 8M]|uniref:CGNR zinc finger domain-containing protein n=1 Tax=Microbacterium sp. 8M TaxID=2653153 RepID=UPI0019159A5C|nr:ABATE domain-containing protein [Microbacterium sp. 8M]